MNSTKENRYCIYSKGVFILENNMYFEEQQLAAQKRFYFPCNKCKKLVMDNRCQTMAKNLRGHKTLN